MYPQDNDATYGNFLYLGAGKGLRDNSPVYRLFYGDTAKSTYSDDVKNAEIYVGGFVVYT